MIKYECPYRPHIMSKVKAANSEPDKMRSSLVYEVFQVDSEKDFSDFLKEIGLGGLNLKAVSDAKYKAMWKNIKGAEIERFLLYPAGDSQNRLYDSTQNDNDDDMPEELKKFTKNNCSEIDVILQYIQNSTDYTCEEIHGFGYDDPTYSYNISDDIGQTFYTIRPCCPVCRTLLPDNWFSDVVKAYVPIALIGEKSAGKTTYMSSLLGKTFKELFMGLSEVDCVVNDAIDEDDKRFRIQATRYENLERLEDGKYPEPTKMLMPPVCLNISHNNNGQESQMIIGIFDCDGELFDPRRRVTQAEMKFLCNMQSYIYLVEPKQMAELDYRFVDENIEFIPDLIKSIEEQGYIQKQNKGHVVNAADIIKNTSQNGAVNDPTEMLLKIKSKLRGQKLCVKHIAYTIVKSDILLDYETKFKDIAGMEDILKPAEEYDVLNKAYRATIDDTVRDFFKKVVFSPKTVTPYMKIFENMGSSEVSKSWHCVSVAKHIPQNERVNGKVCEFAPVRIVEPFIRCLIPQMVDMGWIEE